MDESCFLLGRGQAVQQFPEGHTGICGVAGNRRRFPAFTVIADLLPLDDDGVVILLGEAENVVVAEAYLLAELIGNRDVGWERVRYDWDTSSGTVTEWLNDLHEFYIEVNMIKIWDLALERE